MRNLPEIPQYISKSTRHNVEGERELFWPLQSQLLDVAVAWTTQGQLGGLVSHEIKKGERFHEPQIQPTTCIIPIRV